MRKKILIVEAGSEYNKSHLIEATKQLHYDFYLLQTTFFKGINSWVKNWFPQDRIIDVDSFDEEHIYHKVSEFSAGNSIAFDGVITFWEGFVPIAHHLQTKLELPLICNGGIKKLRHKGVMREHVSNSIMQQPKSHTLGNDRSNELLPNGWNYPVVVKPAEMAASLGVTKVSNDKELVEAIAWAQAVDLHGADVSYRKCFRLSDDVLIEEYIECDYEISIEGLVFHGMLNIAAVCQKLAQPEPYYWEYGHVTPPLNFNVSMIKRLKFELQSVVSSLELYNCAIHAEVRVKGGHFYFIEVGARICGDLIPEIVTHSTGVNLFSLAVPLSCDECPDTSDIKPARCAGEYRFNTVHTPHGLPALRAKKYELCRLNGVKYVKIKDEVDNTIFGDLIATADSGADLLECFERAKQILSD